MGGVSDTQKRPPLGNAAPVPRRAGRALAHPDPHTPARTLAHRRAHRQLRAAPCTSPGLAPGERGQRRRGVHDARPHTAPCALPLPPRLSPSPLTQKLVDVDDGLVGERLGLGVGDAGLEEGGHGEAGAAGLREGRRSGVSWGAHCHAAHARAPEPRGTESSCRLEAGEGAVRRGGRRQRQHARAGEAFPKRTRPVARRSGQHARVLAPPPPLSLGPPARCWAHTPPLLAGQAGSRHTSGTRAQCAPLARNPHFPPHQLTAR